MHRLLRPRQAIDFPHRLGRSKPEIQTRERTARLARIQEWTDVSELLRQDSPNAGPNADREPPRKDSGTVPELAVAFQAEGC